MDLVSMILGLACLGCLGRIRPPHLRLVDVYFGVCLSSTSMLVGVVSWLGEGLEEGLM